MYFSGRHKWARTPNNEHRECIGVATATSLNEDFTPEDYPLVCSQFEEGVIDPSVLQEAGHVYLYFKSDGNCCNLRSGIYAVELTADGLALASTPKPLGVINDREWEGTTVESPTMLKEEQRHFLFYSGSDYWNPSYGVGYAECEGPLGPCKKPVNNVVLSSSGARSGPGHQSVLAVGGKYLIAYHTLKPGAEHAFGAPRVLPSEPSVLGGRHAEAVLNRQPLDAYRRAWRTAYPPQCRPSEPSHSARAWCMNERPKLGCAAGVLSLRKWVLGAVGRRRFELDILLPGGHAPIAPYSALAKSVW